MGDHDTFYTLLMPEFWARLNDPHGEVANALGRKWQWMMFGETHFTLLHVVAALITFVVKGLSEVYDPRGGFPVPVKNALIGEEPLYRGPNPKIPAAGSEIARVTDVADRYQGTDREGVAFSLHEVERSLLMANRSMDRARRALGY